VPQEIALQLHLAEVLFNSCRQTTFHSQWQLGKRQMKAGGRENTISKERERAEEPSWRSVLDKPRSRRGDERQPDWRNVWQSAHSPRWTARTVGEVQLSGSLWSGLNGTDAVSNQLVQLLFVEHRRTIIQRAFPLGARHAVARLRNMEHVETG